MATTAIPMLRDVLDQGIDPTTYVPIDNLVGIMFEAGRIANTDEGPETARAARAALLDGVCGEEDEPSVLIAMSWAVELLENPDLAPRLIRSSKELFVETIMTIREAAGLGES